MSREDRLKKTKKMFFECIGSRLKDFELVVLSDDDFRWIKKEIVQICSHKVGGNEPGDEHYGIDSLNLSKRFMSGVVGELAFLKFLGFDREKIDTRIGGSRRFNDPDFKSIGLRLGSKSADWGFPLVFSEPKWPEVISVYLGKSVYLCGIASVKVQKEFSSKELVKDDNMYNRGTKKGFFGFDRLVPLGNVSYENYRL